MLYCLSQKDFTFVCNLPIVPSPSTVSVGLISKMSCPVPSPTHHPPLHPTPAWLGLFLKCAFCKRFPRNFSHTREWWAVRYLFLAAFLLFEAALQMSVSLHNTVQISCRRVQLALRGFLWYQDHFLPHSKIGRIYESFFFFSDIISILFACTLCL